MGKGNFRRDAVRRTTERGYPVSEVCEAPGCRSAFSLYAWKEKFSQPSDADDRAAEVRRLKKELARASEERDILKKATAYFAKDAKRDTRSSRRTILGLCDRG